MEKWLDSILESAEHLNIESVILKPENKKPTTRYGVDMF
jgi:hypothetical protein